jgi:hypothetical protein
MRQTADNKAFPRNLKVKISPSLFLAYGRSGVFMKLFGIGLAAMGLHGTLVLHPGEQPHHSGLMFLIGPWFFPAIVVIGYTFFPFRPYRGTRFVEKKRDIDVTDPVVMHLVELFKCTEARRHLWCRTFLGISGILFLVMGLFAVLHRHTLSWSLSPVDLGGAGLAIGGSLIAVSADLISWGLKTWAERETGLNAD